jgi:hypothetical protein
MDLTLEQLYEGMSTFPTMYDGDGLSQCLIDGHGVFISDKFEMENSRKWRLMMLAAAIKTKNVVLENKIRRDGVLKLFPKSHDQLILNRLVSMTK